MERKELFEIIDSLEDKYISFWQDVCNIESPTDFKEGVDAVGRYFIAAAEKLGFSVEVAPQSVSGDVVCITMNPDAKEAPVAMSGHMDTVHAVGSFGTPAVTLDGEKIYGPGVTDCKGGAVAAFMAMHALKEYGFVDRPVMLLLQSDEENSSITSDKATVRFMAEKAKACAAFLNCEGYTPNQYTLERKGIIRYVFDITGKAAHSSKCYDGVNAIIEAAHKMIELEKWKEADGITCNCGLISGGTVANTVPENCTFVADIRFRTKAQLETVKKRVEEIAATSYIGNTTCTFKVKSHRAAMEKCEKNVLLLSRINEIFKACGFGTVAPNLSNGGSDAADITAYGIPCIDSMGVHGGKIHSCDEYAYLSSLADTAKRLAIIAAEI